VHGSPPARIVVRVSQRATGRRVSRLTAADSAKTCERRAHRYSPERMPAPFETHERRGIALLVGKRRGALRELEDLLARAERVRDVSVDRVRELAERQGVDLTTGLR